MPSYDVIVVGLGAYGSATLYQLAKRGVAAIGIDRFDPPHEMGSTLGETRGTYEAGVHGSEHHVPFSRRTFELWRELEQESGAELFMQKGILIMGSKDGEIIPQTLNAASATGVEFEQLDALAIHDRIPSLMPDNHIVGIFQPKGGFMRIDPIVGLQLQLASERGAELRTNEPVTAWKTTGSGIEVTTSRDSYRAEKVIFASGAYLPGLVPDLPVQLNAERQVVAFWKPKAHAGSFTQEHTPVWMCETRHHDIVYGFPDIGSGVKTGIEYAKATVTNAETVDRSVSRIDIESMRIELQTIQPEVLGEYLRGVVCLYTCTPDRQFILDAHPSHPNVLIACICNGQGFKYSAAFGEALAQLAVDGRTKFDISPWSLDRFAAAR